MNRLGFMDDQIDDLTALLSESPQLKVVSAFSHLAASDEPSQRDFTQQQIQRFRKMTESLRRI